MRAFLSFLYALLLAPAVALGQTPQAYQGPAPQETGAGIIHWFWWACIAAVMLIALLAWARARDVDFQRLPPVEP
ncbi:MAG: hypothetical protein L0Y66_02110 [Myxococcaceae bacterium]|nr:hypothetical protein [Myxococcaceae bacterium]MCI0673942.1 hypothetical protein [Myxococcaceae bacterium]